MNKKKKATTTFNHPIKKKLMAATSMLMVAVIMMVSSTYAWFTLSTAPEVTGITTAVGANGNLEMALATESTWKTPADVSSAQGDSMAVKEAYVANVTWGNLVDVSATENYSYGLETIQLLPAKLKTTAVGDTVSVDSSNYLMTPKYGSDGRVSELASDTVTGIYDTAATAFKVGTGMGVRAIGTASEMTERQTAYRAARGALSQQSTSAKTNAATSLNQNGNALADILVGHATAGGNDKYSNSDLDVLVAIIERLTAANNSINQALTAAVKGYIASGKAQDPNQDGKLEDGISDEAYSVLANAIDVSTCTVDETAGTADVNGQTLPVGVELAKAIKKHQTITAGLADASSQITTARDSSKAADEDYLSWNQFATPMYNLINTAGVSINGEPLDTFKDNLDDAAGSILKNGINVELNTGSGVYADIADLTGDYAATVTISELSYGGMTVNNLDAKMTTKSSVNPSYFASITTFIDGLGAPSAGDVAADAKITDTYGYALDLLFRTNAANSDLLLQTDAAQRIYSDSTHEDTMGNGSNMTFTPTGTFTVESMKKLMGAIRVVIMDNTNAILAYAKLDMTAAETAGQEVKAPLKLYTPGATVAEDTFLETQKITALSQNIPMGISVLVYLDGDLVDNTMVANDTSSMTGSMNLQFASSAQLQPMQYGELYVKDNAATPTATPTTTP